VIRRLATLLLLMLAVPMLAFAVAHGLLSRHEHVWQDALARQRSDLAVPPCSLLAVGGGAPAL
jgi:hypothetical protein